MGVDFSPVKGLVVVRDNGIRREVARVEGVTVTYRQWRKVPMHEGSWKADGFGSCCVSTWMDWCEGKGGEA